MSTESLHEQVARELLASAQVRGAELERRVEQAMSPDFWADLVPELTVGGRLPSDWDGAAALDAATVDDVVERFDVEGYLQVAPLLPTAVSKRMQIGVERLIANDWPAVFAWVFDECWRASRSPSLDAIFSRILGPGYRQTPYVWTHIVGRARGAAGWPPHVDNPGDTLRLTVWIPVTDATVDTGCMCVIPRNLAPPPVDGQRWYERGSLSKAEVRAVLHASRPLPARAGSVLGWDAGLVHWGLARQAAGDPRMSLSMEFIAADAAPEARDGAFETGASPLPSHAERLATIAGGITLYQASERGTVRYAALAERLSRELGRA